MGMRYMICQQATNRFRPSELTKHYPRCPLTELMLRPREVIKMNWHWVTKRVTEGLYSRSTFGWMSYDGKYPFNNIISFIFYIITNFSLLNSCCLLL